ncbi:MAG: VWA domain-containing protein [Akkermansiaceae bacterium]|nr:VWA domain-containing protein [Armatimonadota bacterium]
MKNRFLNTLIVIAALGGSSAPQFAVAQDTSPVDATLPSDAQLGESAAAVKSLRSVSPKTLIFVFDVSGSMRGELLRRAREATITILREGTQPGDRVILYTFGAGYEQVFDQTLKNEAQKRDLIALVPTKPGDGAGTNIRKPHHDGLKVLEKNLPNPGAVILLTDSFNDSPKKDDPAYPTYLQYYVPGAGLQKHPNTPENRDYERLLRLMTDSQKVQIFGIGVQIDKSGRPVEQLPQAEPTPTTATDGGTQASTPVATVGATKKSGLPLEWLIGGGLLGLALVAGLVAFLRGSKPVALRIKGNPGGAKDFEIASGQSVNIGGVNTHAFDAYALPGTTNPVATLRGASGGRFNLAPVTQEGGAPAAKVSLNGSPLEKESPLTFGDEVRISVPEASGAIKEYRLIFDDPTKSF